MEFKQYLKILKSNIIVIIIFAVLGVAVALAVSTKVSYPYKQSQLIFLQTTGEENNTNQNYSGYYAQEKARNFTDTAVSILNNAEFQSEVKTQAIGFDAKKLAPQLIRATISTPNSQDQSMALNQAVEILNSKIKSITGQNFIEAKPLSSPSQATYSAPDKKVMAIAGLVAGFIFALATLSAKTYFKL